MNNDNPEMTYTNTCQAKSSVIRCYQFNSLSRPHSRNRESLVNCMKYKNLIKRLIYKYEKYLAFNSGLQSTYVQSFNGICSNIIT